VISLWYGGWGCYWAWLAQNDKLDDKPKMRIQIIFRGMEILLLTPTAHLLARAQLSFQHGRVDLFDAGDVQRAGITAYCLRAGWAVFGADTLEFLWASVRLWAEWRRGRADAVGEGVYVGVGEGQDVEDGGEGEDGEEEGEEEVVGGGRD